MGDLGLLDSLVSQRADGALVVGRGVPGSWLTAGRPIAVSGFPAADGRRIGVAITERHNVITLSVTGNPSGPVIFTPGSPSDWRYARNLAAELRRAGLKGA